MTTSIQTCGSYDGMTDEFTFSMVFGDNPALTFEGMTREQVTDIRDCLDCMLWQEQDSDYGETIDEIRKVLGYYVSAQDEEEAAAAVISRIRDMLLCMVNFEGDGHSGSLHWPDVEAAFTRPLDYD